jgi:V8-like Glu-specific endopeptidase
MPPTPPTGSDPIIQDPPKSSTQPQASAVEYPYQFPFSTIGRVFFTDPVTKGNYSCSATVVTSENRSTVDTAGHCVAAGGQKHFYTNWAFCAQYKDGCPTGHLWTARNLVTHSKWYVEGSIAYDYGVAVLSPNSNGKVVDYIGGAGWAYNQPYDQLYYALGFPAGRPFDGKEMKLCTSLISQYDVPSTGPTALGVLCDMTGGSSGGGWLIALKGTFGYTNGHNDYKYVADSTRMYSPYYGKDWFTVFNAGQKL